VTIALLSCHGVERIPSWKEIKNGNRPRQFDVNFLSKTATAQNHENSELKDWSEKIEVETGRTFAGFGFTLALQNLRKCLIDGGQLELSPSASRRSHEWLPSKFHMALSIRCGCRGGLRGDRFVIHPKIPLIAKLFIDVPDT